MKTPTTWQLLETIPGPAAVPAVWRASFGVEFDAFRESFLRQLPTPAKSYPCPRECGCSHEVVRHRSGSIVAVCRCDPCRCADIPLQEADIAVLEMNWSALGRAIASAFGLTAREADVGVRGAIQIAATGRDALPVVLVIRNDRESFRQTVDALVARLGGRFMVVAPTADFMDAAIQQILSGANARFLSLDMSVRINESGALLSTEPANGSGSGKQKNGWDGLRIGEIFEPRTMAWNGKAFLIEEPAICYKGYDLENTSLEDYYPELREDWDRHITDVPFDEVENLRILRLVSGEKTLLIHVMLRESVPVYPERLESSGETDGWHEGGVALVDGQRFEVKGVHVEPTDPKVSAKIEAARRARRPVVVGAVITGDMPHGAEGPVSRTTLEAIHADIRQIKDIAAPLPAAVAKVDKGLETVQKHVRGVPILQAELAEAKLVPESLAVEIHSRIADILSPEEQAIWHAMRKAGGSQKNALPSLRQSGVVNSAPVLSRRVRAINPKLLANNLPACDAPAPAVTFTKHGGYVGKDGDEVPEELSAVERDWAKDPAERDTTIQSYLTASPEDKEYFHQTKPGIQEEADKYLKRRRRN